MMHGGFIGSDKVSRNNKETRQEKISSAAVLQ